MVMNKSDGFRQFKNIGETLLPLIRDGQFFETPFFSSKPDTITTDQDLEETAGRRIEALYLRCVGDGIANSCSICQFSLELLRRRISESNQLPSRNRWSLCTRFIL